MSAPLHSRVCRGWVRHRRRLAPQREFRYRVTMLYLDLDELEAAQRVSRLFGVERARPWSFRRRDYLAPHASSLADAARDAVAADCGRRPRGPVRLLTQVRALGYVFNPVSFYYCFAEDGATLEAVVAEITNTPWRERHHYVVARAPGARGPLRREFAKDFHVSPFLDMEQRYRWTFAEPGARIAVAMRNERAGARVFDATLQLETQPFEARTLRRALIRAPLPGWAAHAAIYWQALRLWLRRAPFHVHPRHRRAAGASSHAV